MQISIKSASLTSSGITKLKKFVDLSQRALAAMLEDASIDLKKKIASFAPDEKEELQLLSYPGYDQNIFKKKEVQFLYLREAIIAEKIAVRTTANGIITAKFGDTKKINSQIGFAWYAGSKRKGNVELRSTRDPEAGEAWQHLLEAFEFGGSIFTVTPRDPNGSLLLGYDSAGKAIREKSVQKQIPTIPRGMPFSMYSAGSYFFENTLYRRTKNRLKEVISWL